MPFNPITLEYEKSDQGLGLMEKDEQAKVLSSLLENSIFD